MFRSQVRDQAKSRHSRHVDLAIKYLHVTRSCHHGSTTSQRHHVAYLAPPSFPAGLSGQYVQHRKVMMQLMLVAAA